MSVSEEQEEIDEGQQDGSEKRVAPLELFFDLVFVFALTQVTLLMAEHPTWEGLGQGMLVLAALWWAWAAYAWLTNYIDTERDTERLLMFAAMAAMLLSALAAPHAFGDDAALFGISYAVVRLLHIFIFAEANDDVDTAQALRVLSRSALPAPLLILAAGFTDGTTQAVLWILALTIDFAGPFVFGVRGFKVSAAHFAERFSLILIIALGESIVAIGAGIEGEEIDGGLVLAAVMTIVLAAGMWWAYFDVVAVVSERRFSRTRGDERARMARDSYSYIHLFMVAGIVLVALGVKKTVGHVDEPLKQVPAAALFGGMALYYGGHVAFRLRNVHSLNRQRVFVAILCLALIPVATEVDAVVALGTAAAISAALIAYETLHFADARRRVRESSAASGG
jgi:low temperature requirement protein LtrA